MTFSAYATLIIANLIGAMSPGPDMILITRLATKSRRHALSATLGIIVGVLFWCTLTVAGAAALISAFPSILGAVQLVGGAWIFYTGIRTFRAGWAARGMTPASVAEAEASLGRLRKAFYLGLGTNMSNPKIVLFLGALVAPLLPPNPSVALAAFLIFSMTFSCLLLFIAVSVVVSTNRVRRALLSAGPMIDMGAGAFFVFAGCGLLIAGLRAVTGI